MTLVLRNSAAAVAILVLSLVAAETRAQSVEARQFLERRHASVMKVLRNPPKTEAARARRDTKLDEMLSGLLDYQELSRRSLGSHWKKRSAQERRVFTELLEKLVERSYKRNLEQTSKYRVRYMAGQASGEGVLVRTEARSKKNPRAPTVSIDYRLHRVDGQWRVYDVITDGVSMVRNYRNQFNRIIDKEGWSGLLKRMRKKLGSDEDLTR